MNSLRAHLIHSIHIKRCRIETILSFPIDVLWSTATGWNSRSRSVVLIKPISRSVDSAAHQFPLNCVPCHHVILWSYQILETYNAILKKIFKFTLFWRVIDFCNWTLRISRKSFLKVMAAIPTAISTMKMMPKRKANWNKNRCNNCLSKLKLNIQPWEALAIPSRLHSNPGRQSERSIGQARSKLLAELWCVRRGNEWNHRHRWGLRSLRSEFQGQKSEKKLFFSRINYKF